MLVVRGDDCGRTGHHVGAFDYPVTLLVHRGRRCQLDPLVLHLGDEV